MFNWTLVNKSERAPSELIFLAVVGDIISYVIVGVLFYNVISLAITSACGG